MFFLELPNTALGERASFLAEDERAVSSNLNSDALYDLAAVRAKLGETDRAIELYEFRREYETLERRLRETY